MPPIRYRKTFEKGVNLDIAFEQMPQDALAFAKNLQLNVESIAGGADNQGGVGQYKPIESNVEVELELPAGDNFCIGSYSSDQTGELYWIVWNSEDNHSIWRMNGNGGVDKIYSNEDAGQILNFELNPQYFISETRITMFVKDYTNPVSGGPAQYKFLIFTDNNDYQFCIETESSFATTSYTDPSATPPDRFYNPSGAFYNPKELSLLGVPSPISQIGIEPIDNTGDELLLQNNLIRHARQFRIKYIDAFGRESTWGLISDPYISTVGGGCIANSNGQPRCLNLLFSAGNPLVSQIEIGVREWVGNDRGGAIASDWKSVYTLQKYYVNDDLWWDRVINTNDPNWTWDSSTNQIEFTYCADGLGIPVDKNDTDKTQPGIPLQSGGITAINESVLLSDNQYGFNPIIPFHVNQFTVEATAPDAPCQSPGLVSCTFYAVIGDDGNITGTPSSRYIRYQDDLWGFGNAVKRGDQVFGDQAYPGFIGYAVGQAQNAAISVQGYLDASNKFIPIPLDKTGTMPITPPSGTAWIQQITIWVPRGKYVVRLASHKSKISSNNLVNTSTYVQCITTMADANTLAGGTVPLTMFDNSLKEIEIDCSGPTPVVLNQPSDPVFYIADMSLPKFVAAGYLVEDENKNSAIPIEMQPVLFVGQVGALEIAGDVSALSAFTDHNGFYFGGCKDGVGKRLVMYISIDVCDGEGPNKVIILDNGENCTFLYGYGTGTALNDGASGVVGNYLNTISCVRGSDVFPDTGRITIIQPVHICDTTDPLPGVPMVMTKGAFAVTGNDGIATFISHNRYDYVTTFNNPPSFTTPHQLPVYTSRLPDYSAGSNANDVLVVGQKGGCTWTACGGPCGVYGRSDLIVNYIPCDCTGCPLDCVCVPRVNNMPQFELAVNGANIKGVQSGGRYGYGFVLFDILGRHTFVQAKFGDSGFATVPHLNDAGYQNFGLYKLTYIMDPDFQVPDNFVALVPCVTDNTLFSDFISWTADIVQYVDASGNNNAADPTSIRIYWGSLNEYNKQYAFATNTQWQPLVETINGVSTPQQGDIVEFICPGDDTANGVRWFTAPLTAPITYNQDGAFFTVDYDPKLANLSSGTLFRIVRPKLEQQNYIYYMLNLVIKLENGMVADPDQLTGELPWYDSYMLNRAIPVPVPKSQPWNVAPGQRTTNPYVYTSVGDTTATSYSGNNNANYNNVIVMSPNDSIATFPFFFESPSPSDFWGSHLAYRGLVNTTNPYESQYRLTTEIFLSEPLNSRPNSLNGLSYFQKTNPATGAKNAITFPKDTWGNIVGVMVETSVCLVITDVDNFLITYNGSNVKVGVDGTLVAQSEFGLFTAPQRNAGTNYGCPPLFINSISKYGGVVYWVDSSGYLSKHNFKNAQPIEEMGYGAYFRNKVALANIRNGQGTETVFCPVGKIDPLYEEYNLTFFLYNAELPVYLNTESQVNLSQNETMVINAVNGTLKGFASYTPEFYASFPQYAKQRTLISFKEGVPYIHHYGVDDQPSAPFCEFYGTQCFPNFSAVFAPGADLVKRWMAIEVYTKYNEFAGTGEFTEVLFFLNDPNGVVTEKDQLSRILIPQWTQQNQFAAAPFFCDTQTVPDPNLPDQTGINVIRDGDPLIGKWIALNFSTNPGWNGTYFDITSLIITFLGIKQSGDAK